MSQVEEEEDRDFLEVFSDSNWAGDKSSSAKRRHSVSSVFMFRCLITSWSRSQKSISLSSCEAEFLASARGVAEAPGQRSVAVLEPQDGDDQSHHR